MQLENPMRWCCPDFKDACTCRVQTQHRIACSVPDADLLPALPQLLGPLLAMASDPNRELRQAVLKTLQVGAWQCARQPQNPRLSGHKQSQT